MIGGEEAVARVDIIVIVYSGVTRLGRGNFQTRSQEVTARILHP
jgi:hypothetical protein